MSNRRQNHSSFPFYLKPGPNRPALEWLGIRLKQERGIRTLEDVANAAKVRVDELHNIEKGTFHLNAGRLRDIVRLGYKADFLSILAECYEANQTQFDPSGLRPFERDFHYSLCLGPNDERQPTPLLVGGDPNSYLWAMPMRRLKGQPMLTELLELAPFRKKLSFGMTPDNSHQGTEIVFVKHGTIDVHMAIGAESNNTRRLKGGDCIHFKAGYPHRLENNEKNTSALLFVVRLAE